MDFRGSSNRKAIGLVLLVFALGIALGAVGSMLLNRDVFASRGRVAVQGQAPRGRLVTRLTSDLSLNTDQQNQLRDALAEAQKRYDAVHAQMNPELAQVRNEMRDRIRQILTPEQRPKFEDFLSQVDEERRKRTAQNQR